MTIMLFGSEIEFSTLKVHKLGANGQRTKICRALLFQARGWLTKVTHHSNAREGNDDLSFTKHKRHNPTNLDLDPG